MPVYNNGTNLLLEEDGNLKKESVFCILDDKQHDTLFIQHSFKIHYERLVSQGLKFKRHWVWLDGGASQFKVAPILLFCKVRLFKVLANPFFFVLS